MILIQNLGKRFGKLWALKNISLKLDKGEILGVVGRNGCGKTTLLKLIAGILKPTTGRIVSNSNIVSYIPEEPILIPELTLKDNLSYFASFRKISKKKIDEEINFFGLEEHLYKKPLELSKGLQQRLSMIIALLPNPDIILMDEPTSGLDVESKKLILERIKKIKETGRIIFYVTHEDEEIEKVCDKVLILENGENIFLGSVKDFWERYERYVYVIQEGNRVPILIKVDDLGKLKNIIHVRSVGIREFLSGGVNFEINGQTNFTETNGN
ncbi:MAG: ABC transporter ATP-binding protein [Thermosipho sp. (in: Bacteria)]|nr:ABC transporter ATP-binding protein [Thermosipho sp. (in: thermotogales)]